MKTIKKLVLLFLAISFTITHFAYSMEEMPFKIVIASGF